MSLLREIERHLNDTQTPPTRFGKAAMRDPRFVFDLRRGRTPTQRVERRVRAYLDKHLKGTDA